MPYRALLATVVTVALALLAVGMWAAVVGPMLTAAQEATATTAPGGGAPTPPVATRPDASVLQLHALARGVLILSFLLIVTLLIVGVAATIRAWIRVKRPGRRRVRTRFVDAWKIAGERIDAKGEKGAEGEPPLQ